MSIEGKFISLPETICVDNDLSKKTKTSSTPMTVIIPQQSPIYFCTSNNSIIVPSFNPYNAVLDSHIGQNSMWLSSKIFQCTCQPNWRMNPSIMNIECIVVNNIHTNFMEVRHNLFIQIHERLIANLKSFLH